MAFVRYRCSNDVRMRTIRYQSQHHKDVYRLPTTRVGLLQQLGSRSSREQVTALVNDTATATRYCNHIRNCERDHNMKQVLINLHKCRTCYSR